MSAEFPSHRCSFWHPLRAALGSVAHAAKPDPLSSPIVGILAGIVAFCFIFTLAVHAQGPGQAPSGRPASFDAAENTGPGKDLDGYFVQQSVEIGGRFTQVTGNEDMYNTLVDLHTGPRVLEQSLTMQALPDHKSFFDSLYEESFGWGGDPSNAARLRVSKHGVYNFDGSFRRDQNFFDDNLLANPLLVQSGPPSTFGTAPNPPFVVGSPHAMSLRRRMYDFNLVVFPQRRFSFNLGFSRNRNEGQSFSSIHERADALMLQDYNTTDDIYRMGASWRALPRTTVTFNESLQSIKYDTSYPSLAPLVNPIIISSGFLTTSGAPANFYLAPPGANSDQSYSRFQRYRNFLPTEQATITSSSIRRVEFTARFMYSNADANTPEFENFSGVAGTTLASNTCPTAANCTTAHARWVSEQADGGATIHVTSHLRLVDSFRFYAYRIPGVLEDLGTVTTTTGTTSTNELFLRFSQQSIKSNEFDVQYDISRHLGARVGYLYRNIFDNHYWFTCGGLIGAVANPVASCISLGSGVGTVGTLDDLEVGATTLGAETPINQHWGIAGVWYRPSRQFHVDGEVRIMSGDSYVARIDARRQQQYRANVTYTPKTWLTMAANANLLEQRNNSDTGAAGAAEPIGYNAHYRNFGFSIMATPHNRLMVDVAYNYSNSGQNANICYATTSPTLPPGTVACPNDATNTNQSLGFYLNHTHYGTANVQFKPVHRLTLGTGYSIVRVVDGSTLDLNGTALVIGTTSFQPAGALASSYQQIFGTVGVQVVKNVELRAGWNYYQYNEDAPSGPTLNRYFHANVTTASLRYAF